jgi:hypothetical protein
MGPGFRRFPEDVQDAVGREENRILIGSFEEGEAKQIGPACRRQEAV